MFRAISRLMHGNQDLHMQLRRRAVAHMRAHRNHFLYSGEDNVDLDTYLAEMEVRGTWGGGPEIAALEEILDYAIVVHKLDLAGNYVQVNNHQGHPHQLHLALEGGHFSAVQAPETTLPLPGRSDNGVILQERLQRA